jgi:hypothetical protein
MISLSSLFMLSTKIQFLKKMMPKFNANIQFKLSLKEILKINNNKMKKIKSSFA